MTHRGEYVSTVLVYSTHEHFIVLSLKRKPVVTSLISRDVNSHPRFIDNGIIWKRLNAGCYNGISPYL